MQIKRKMKSIFISCCIAAFSLCVVSKNNAQYSEFGIGLGFTTYWGDLNAPSFTTNMTKQSGLALQLSARKMYGRNLGARLSFGYGTVKGNDANSSQDWQKLRNLSFKSPIIDLAIAGEYYIFGFNPEAGESVFAPYITAGLAGFRFNPKTIYQGNEIKLQPLGTEGQGMPGFDNKYSLYNIGLLFGGGAKIIFTENLNLGLEMVMRRTLTDYLDDISDKYVNYDDLSAGNGALAASLGNRMNEYLGQVQPVQLPTGSQRGGAKVKDYYIFSMVSLNFVIDNNRGKRIFGRGNKVICPKF